MPLSFPFYHIGHFLNQPDTPMPFAITEFGKMEVPEVEDPHKHSFYEILWVDEGTSIQGIEDQTYHLEAESLFFISPGQLHEFVEWRHLQGGTLFFTREFLQMHPNGLDSLLPWSFLDNVYAQPNLDLPTETFQEIRATIQWMIRELSRSQPSMELLRSLLQVLLIQIQRSIHDRVHVPIEKPSMVLFKRFQQRIEETYAQSISVADHAEGLHVTPHQLNRACKEVTGHSPSQIIKNRKLLEAKRLLAFTHEPISDIAMSLGIEDSAYFARIFRQEIGLSPKAYRTQQNQSASTES
ncbi:AraC family transcriptional regulator [Pontibacter sp. G13]|uniref:helix-turn-helix transcriptional regulator n=1 Tax=Pontibacter sp. G13 TaxID=3074898 RepID=UPI00288BF52D|nr:AraC family transcriptional regulator [Pontibacter sp. G13]WNJ18171.1 AraC family transcriptional regulator [Pontibacter sp. G13]